MDETVSPATNDLDSSASKISPPHSGNTPLIAAVAVIVIVIAVGCLFLYSKGQLGNKSASRESENRMLTLEEENQSSPSADGATIDFEELDSDLQTIEGSLDKLDLDIEDIDKGFSDQQGDLSEQ